MAKLQNVATVGRELKVIFSEIGGGFPLFLNPGFYFHTWQSFSQKNIICIYLINMAASHLCLACICN